MMWPASRLLSTKILALGSVGRLRRPTSKEDVSNLIVFEHGSTESHFAHQVQPSRAWKQTLNVVIVHHVGLAFVVAQQDREVNNVSAVARVRVEDPLQE